jgi:hypothetical protein
MVIRTAAVTVSAAAASWTTRCPSERGDGLWLRVTAIVASVGFRKTMAPWLRATNCTPASACPRFASKVTDGRSDRGSGRSPVASATGAIGPLIAASANANIILERERFDRMVVSLMVGWNQPEDMHASSG